MGTFAQLGRPIVEGLLEPTQALGLFTSQPPTPGSPSLSSGKKLTPFGRQRNAVLHDLVGLGDVVSSGGTLAPAPDRPDSALSSVVLPAVGAEDHGQAGLHLQFEIAQHEERAVARAQPLSLRSAQRAQHKKDLLPYHIMRWPPPSRPPGRPRSLPRCAPLPRVPSAIYCAPGAARSRARVLEQRGHGMYANHGQVQLVAHAGVISCAMLCTSASAARRRFVHGASMARAMPISSRRCCDGVMAAAGGSASGARPISSRILCASRKCQEPARRLPAGRSRCWPPRSCRQTRAAWRVQHPRRPLRSGAAAGRPGCGHPRAAGRRWAPWAVMALKKVVLPAPVGADDADQFAGAGSWRVTASTAVGRQSAP